MAVRGEPTSVADTAGAELDRILATRCVTPVFQPIVELATGRVVAYEALARGPVGGAVHLPDELFAVARRSGRLQELDRLCRARALEEAAAAGLRDPVRLFLNVEPAALLADRAGPSAPAPRDDAVTPVYEITERALTGDPAGLLEFADTVRARGGFIALDDVGANPDSLALMPFLRPDVIKLDMRLVQARPDRAIAETMTAVTAHAERTGARVLAEGVETEAHEHMARSLGAGLGQGWRYGRPGPLPAASPMPSHPITTDRGAVSLPARSPYLLARRGRTPQRTSKSLLVAISKLLERQALEMGHLAVIVSAFEHVRHVTPSTRRRYAELGASAALAVALGVGVSRRPAPGVLGADLAPDDPVIGEWDVAVVGPHFAAALVARDLDDDLPEPDRSFDYVLTYDREVVLDVARSLLSRALPAARSRVEELHRHVDDA